MRIVYMGTPDFAVPALDALAQARHEIVAVYSQPPRPAGRGKALRPSPLHQRAEAMGIEVRTPLTLKDAEVQAAFGALTHLPGLHHVNQVPRGALRPVGDGVGSHDLIHQPDAAQDGGQDAS